MSSTRGVLYIVWGNAVEAVLQRSMASVKAVHPELPIEVIRMPDDRPYYALAQKSQMFARSPFDETLFLDVDTVVLDRLDFGFEKAAQFGLACCICECPWACRYDVLAFNPDVIEYNTGVLFFTRKAAPLFEAWARLAPGMESTLRLVVDGKPSWMPYNDQCSFAVAVEETGFLPFILPLNWNFRPEFTEGYFGPIKVYHAYPDPPDGIAECNARYRAGEMIIQRHAVKLVPLP